MASTQSNTRDRVEVPASDEPVASNENPPPRLTIAQRMAAVRAECFGIGKSDIKMGTFNIKGHTFEAVLAEIRPLLAKHGVSVTPNLVERIYSGNRCDVTVDFEFESLDDLTDRKVIRWAGAGTDNGDKAFAKAGTNAFKEMLKKVFLVTDRDDAKEETESVEHQTEDSASRKALEKAATDRRAAIEKWGRAFKSAIENAPTIPDIDRLKRENRDQLESDDLPAVTRDFFLTLISDRKSELEGM